MLIQYRNNDTRYWFLSVSLSDKVNAVALVIKLNNAC